MVQDAQSREGQIAVIGCGNPTRGDDGAGTEIIRILEARGVGSRPAVRLLDAGTDGMRVMFAARGARSLILVDTCRSGSEPGAVFQVPGTELAARYQPSLTLHDFRWEHALHAARQMFGASFPTDVTVFLIEAAAVEFGIGLSQAVAAAVEKVAAAIENEIAVRLKQGALVP